MSKLRTPILLICCLMLCVGIIDGELIRGPSDVLAVTGSTITLQCSTNLSTPVQWQFKRSGADHDEPWRSVYASHPTSQITARYRDKNKYNVTVDSTGNEYNLIIYNLQTDDSGTYRCIDHYGNGESKHDEGIPGHEYMAEVVVVQSLICSQTVNGTDIQLYQTISLQEATDIINITCSLIYVGNVRPSFTWILHNEESGQEKLLNSLQTEPRLRYKRRVRGSRRFSRVRGRRRFSNVQSKVEIKTSKLSSHYSVNMLPHLQTKYHSTSYMNGPKISWVSTGLNKEADNSFGKSNGESDRVDRDNRDNRDNKENRDNTNNRADRDNTNDRYNKDNRDDNDDDDNDDNDDLDERDKGNNRPLKLHNKPSQKSKRVGSEKTKVHVPNPIFPDQQDSPQNLSNDTQDVKPFKETTNSSDSTDFMRTKESNLSDITLDLKPSEAPNLSEYTKDLKLNDAASHSLELDRNKGLQSKFEHNYGNVDFHDYESVFNPENSPIPTSYWSSGIAKKKTDDRIQYDQGLPYDNWAYHSQNKPKPNDDSFYSKVKSWQDQHKLKSPEVPYFVIVIISGLGLAWLIGFVAILKCIICEKIANKKTKNKNQII